MSASKSRKRGRGKTQRYTSNVFNMFNEAQIQEFKEAFNMMDQNKDGFIDHDDLVEMLTSLGKNPSEEYIDEMINQAPGSINFTMFLTLFGEKMSGSDPEETILNAFTCFDPKGSGYVAEDRLRELMATLGDRWTEEQIDELFHGAPIKDGMFDYREFTRMIKHGKKEEDGNDQQL